MPRKKLSEYHTHAARALQIWTVLVGLGMHRMTITYAQLADLIQVGTGNVLGNMLDPLHKWCKHHDYPDITALVVQVGTGEPGFTEIQGGCFRERVFAFTWWDIVPPTLDGLANA